MPGWDPRIFNFYSGKVPKLQFNLTRMYFYNWCHSERLADIAAILFLTAFLFLFLFRPFTVEESELKYSYLFTCFLHSLSPALIVFGYFTTLMYVGKANPVRNKATALRWVPALIILFLLIGISSFLLRDYIYVNPNNWSLRYLWEEIRNAYLAGGLFSSYFVFAGFYLHTREDPLTDYTIADKKVAATINEMDIFIRADVKIDDFSFSASDFLFARAEGNYIELTMRHEGGLRKVLKRIALKQLELQLVGYSCFFRCHRAYLVNMEQIAGFSGNSQGYLVSFDGLEDKVQVSRAKLALFDQRFSGLISG